MAKITIYHNPTCSNSRNTLALMRELGHDPHVVLYLETPPSRDTLQAIVQATGDSPRALMRSKETIFSELGLDNLQLRDEVLIDAMLAHPILINRPIVVTSVGTRLCRPAEVVLEILPKT